MKAEASVRSVNDELQASNTALLECAARGDEGALEALFRRHLPLMRKIALVEQRVPEAHAEDIFQRVYVDFYKCVGRVERLAAFFVTATRSLSREYFRRVNREKQALSEFAILNVPRPIIDAGKGEDRLIRGLDMAKLLRRVERKCEDLLSAVVLRDVSHAEYASKAGWPIGSVGPTVLRCLEKMRRTLLQSGYRSPRGSLHRA